MALATLPLSGVSYGQTMTFHGISQRQRFPGYIASDYSQVLDDLRGSHPYQSVVAVYDCDVPAVGPFVDTLAKYVSSPLTRLPLKAGEPLKTPNQVLKAVDHLGQQRVTEKSLMFVIGGGTLCNFAGFIAAMWNGMEAVFVPTNFTAIADVAIGSLHMINVGGIKNQLQLFRDPLAVVFDPQFMATLPRAERRNGLAETAKHAVAQDAALFEYLERVAADGSIFRDDLLFDTAIRTAQLKDELMGVDPLGEKTQGIFLYGHVMAHAIESASGYTIPHGEAVSLGILVELAFFHDPTSPLFRRVRALLEHLGLPIQMPENLKVSDVMDHLAHATTEQETLLIPRVKELGALESIGGRYLEKFDHAAIQRALSVIIST